VNDRSCASATDWGALKEDDEDEADEEAQDETMEDAADETEERVGLRDEALDDPDSD